MYIRVFITIAFIAFTTSCRTSVIVPIAPLVPEPIISEAIYAQFTFDYGVKGVSPVDMTNSELTHWRHADRRERPYRC